MISVKAQERLLGAALGGVFSGLIVLEQRKNIYQTIAHLWNKTVDQTLGPLIASLSALRAGGRDI